MVGRRSRTGTSGSSLPLASVQVVEPDGQTGELSRSVKLTIACPGDRLPDLVEAREDHAVRVPELVVGDPDLARTGREQHSLPVRAPGFHPSDSMIVCPLIVTATSSSAATYNRTGIGRSWRLSK
jgi:hypothetical protein